MRQMLTFANPDIRATAAHKAAALDALAIQLRVWVSLRVAAVAIGRHRATLYRWHKHDPAFRAAVDAINQRNLAAYQIQLRREQAARKAVLDAKWLSQRQAHAAYARSCKRR